MSWTVFRSTLHLRRVSLFWYSFSLAIYGWWVVSFYPSIGGDSNYVQYVSEVMGEEMMALFGGSALDLTTFAGFAGIEYLSLMWVLIVAAAMVTFAGGSLGGAVDDGSMEMTLSLPASRTRVVVSRYLAMAAYAGMISFVTSATLYLPSLYYDVEMSLDAAVALFFASWLLMMAIASFAYAVSSLSSSGGRPVAITLGVITAMWIGDALGQLNEDIEWVRDFSLFKYWTPGKILQDEALGSESWIVLGLVTVLFFFAAVLVFRRRDVV